MNRLYHVRSLVKRSISVGCHNRFSSSPKCDFSVEYLPRGSWVRCYSSRAKNVPLTDKHQDSLSGVLSQLKSWKKGSYVASSKWVDVYGIFPSLKEPPSASISVASLKKLRKLKPKPALKKKKKAWFIKLEYISDVHAQADLGTRLCEGQVKQLWGKRETEIRL